MVLWESGIFHWFESLVWFYWIMFGTSKQRCLLCWSVFFLCIVLFGLLIDEFCLLADTMSVCAFSRNRAEQCRLWYCKNWNGKFTLNVLIKLKMKHYLCAVSFFFCTFFFFAVFYAILEYPLWCDRRLRENFARQPWHYAVQA